MCSLCELKYRQDKHQRNNNQNCDKRLIREQLFRLYNIII